MKIRKFIIPILVLILIVITYIVYTNRLNNSKNKLVDDKITTDTVFIDSKDSKYFNYDSKIILNGIKEDDNYISIQYEVTITPLRKEKVKSVMATAFIDEAVFEQIAVKGSSTFGSLPDDKVTIDPSSIDNKGLIITRITWLYEDTDINKLEKDINKGLKVKVSWDKDSENVIIPEEDIEIIVEWYITKI